MAKYVVKQDVVIIEDIDFNNDGDIEFTDELMLEDIMPTRTFKAFVNVNVNDKGELSEKDQQKINQIIQSIAIEDGGTAVIDVETTDCVVAETLQAENDIMNDTAYVFNGGDIIYTTPSRTASEVEKFMIEETVFVSFKEDIVFITSSKFSEPMGRVLKRHFLREHRF